MFPSQYSPFTGRALTHRSRSRNVKSPKSAVVRGLRYQVAREARFRATFSVPHHLWGCGSSHVLGGSFARFCVSENVRVPLRYSGQPLHRKIIASRSPNTPWFCLSNRFFANFNQAIDYNKSIYTDIRQPKINASNQTARVCTANCARFFILAIFGFRLVEAA